MVGPIQNREPFLPREVARLVSEDHSLDVPLPYDLLCPKRMPRIVVVCHAYYVDLLEEIRGYLENIPTAFDLCISTDTSEKRELIESDFRTWVRGRVEVRVTANRGRDIAPKIVEFRDVYQQYDLVLHIHTKRSDHDSVLSAWRGYIYETLLGSTDIVRSVLEIFRQCSDVGMVAAQHFEPVRHWINWGGNFPAAAELANRMGIPIEEDGVLDFPSGSIFWARTSALRPLLDLDLSPQDFEDEEGQIDGTLAHAIERLYFLICERAGLEWVKIAHKPFMPNTPCIRTVASRDELQRFIRDHTFRLSGKHGFSPRRWHEPAIAQPSAELAARLGRISRRHAPDDTDQLWRRIDALRLENHILRQENLDLKNSTSWFVTKPLRFASRFARRILRIPGALVRRARAAPENINAALENINSAVRVAALDYLVRDRIRLSGRNMPFMYSPAPEAWPALDITAVTYNSGRWLESFFESLLAQNYPLERISVHLVDHGSTDGTLDELRRIGHSIGSRFASFNIESAPNRGFGAGHNLAIRRGRAPYVLVTNLDLEFAPDSLVRVLSVAEADQRKVACWELRQLPYEHPKYYDPVTGYTNWCSHACVLMRREALEREGGYDEAIFMYGEDVEISYRFRRGGWKLKYLPTARVLHKTYEAPNTVKPLQFRGAIFASCYLRLKFGGIGEIAAIPFVLLHILMRGSPYQGARRDLWLGFRRFLRYAIPAISARRRSNGVVFPFHGLDFELAREGAFYPQGEVPQPPPLVSVLTRTTGNRNHMLRQAMHSVANQTYGPIEHVIVQDEGDSARQEVESFRPRHGQTIRFVSGDGGGRSAAGNRALSSCSGAYCVFLDDDDLLFADHVETLVQAITDGAVAAYSLAWEVPTEFSAEASRYKETGYLTRDVYRQEFDERTLREYNYMTIQSVLFERRLFLERGGLQQKLDALEDWHLWNKYARGNRFIFVPKTTSLYRMPADEAELEKRLAQHASARSSAVAHIRASLRNIDKQRRIVNSGGGGPASRSVMRRKNYTRFSIFPL